MTVGAERHRLDADRWLRHQRLRRRETLNSERRRPTLESVRRRSVLPLTVTLIDLSTWRTTTGVGGDAAQSAALTNFGARRRLRPCRCIDGSRGLAEADQRHRGRWWIARCPACSRSGDDKKRMNDQGSATRRAAQDDLADRERSAWQRRRVGLQDYVLGMLFYRFISENLTAYLNEHERKAGNADFDYAALADDEAEFGRAETVAEKGFYILPSELFVNVRARARNDENLNETLEQVFKNIEGSAVGSDSEDDLKGLFDDLDVNSSKLGPTVAKRNEKLVKLLDAIGDLALGDFADNTIDAVRRRLRVPDDDVRLQRRQVRRRVLHAAGGRPSCSPGSPSSARPRSTRSTTRRAARARCC